MVHPKPIPINYAMFVNHFAKNAVKTTRIHCCWYEKIVRIDPAQRNSDPPHADRTVVNESSEWLFLSLTLHIRLLQWFLAPIQQWYTAGRLQSTQHTDVEQCDIQRSGDGSLTNAEGHGNIPHKHWWGKFNVHFLLNRCLDNQFRVQVSICSDWHCGWYLLDTLLWPRTNGNER